MQAGRDQGFALQDPTIFGTVQMCDHAPMVFGAVTRDLHCNTSRFMPFHVLPGFVIFTTVGAHNPVFEIFAITGGRKAACVTPNIQAAALNLFSIP